MEEGLFLHTLLPQEPDQCGQELGEEAFIVRPQRVRLPAEDAADFPLNLSHHLGSCCGTPLREQVCHFKVFHTAGQAEVNPAVQQGKVKGVLPGGGNADPHQLCGGALAPDVGVQLRREDGGEDHIDAVLHRRADVGFQNAPVLRGEGLRVIEIGKAVAVEPLGVNQLLRRERVRQDPHGNGDRILTDRNGQGIFAGFQGIR